MTESQAVPKRNPVSGGIVGADRPSFGSWSMLGPQKDEEVVVILFVHLTLLLQGSGLIHFLRPTTGLDACQQRFHLVPT